MISFDFEYHRPENLQDAVNIYFQLKNSGKKPIYYGGGAEIISLARVYKTDFNAVIDLKNISECMALTTEENQITIGAAVPMTKICEANYFPLLTDVIKKAADHTSRNRITLGGNICGSLPYKESVLPLLLCDAQVKIAGASGIKTSYLNQIFDKSIPLQEGEFLVQIIIDGSYAALPFISIKKTKHGGLEYPLISVAAIKKEGQIRYAFSNVCDFPFRSLQIEDDLNNKALPHEERIKNAISHLPNFMVNDFQAAAEFRYFVFTNTLNNIISSFEEVI